MKPRLLARALLGAWLLVLAYSASAHELRPAYLEIRETGADEYRVLWKVPARGQRRLSLHVRLPEQCRPINKAIGGFADAAYLEQSVVFCPGGLTGATVGIDGLQTTLTDALARVEKLDGSVQITRLTPEQPEFELTGSPTSATTAATYFMLGIEHILLGFDHLLFVFALVLLIRDRWMLIKTITAFTVAHSFTLAGSTLGLFSLPQPPVEAVVALSIAFVASEILKRDAGGVQGATTAPWVISFTFGLLHGFGFAGALKEIGLPQSDIFLALLTFNVGVEVGQLLFVAVVLGAGASISAIWQTDFKIARQVLSYAIGAMAMFWVLERISSFYG